MVVPDHWCHVPGREKTPLTVEEWRSLTIPRTHEASCKEKDGKQCCNGLDTTSPQHRDDTKQDVDILAVLAEKANVDMPHSSQTL
ncbi:hypothetical protein E2C01_027169 [Portunus trituberculatus]|uniref:Uncharacterized protein n=1 Tax=Portunus trituberculatus TaxID=210409 RepID=A0A5B7EK51_PORTR|nr:hypothetical protein [Portunus trituberculatus]